MSVLCNSWKNYLLSNPDLEILDKNWVKITELSNPQVPFETSFEELSKNKGIAFICLDPMESFIQLFHHCHVIGGNRASPSKTYLSVLGADKSAKPIQIILKSVKVIKAKTVSLVDLLGDDYPKKSESKTTKPELGYHNILPVPHVLTKAYLSLERFDPKSVAKAFYSAMQEFDNKEQEKTTQVDSDLVPNLQDEEEADNAKPAAESDDKSTNSEGGDSKLNGNCRNESGNRSMV